MRRVPHDAGEQDSVPGRGRFSQAILVDVVMERDVEERTVEAPPELKKELAKSKKAQERWDELAFTHKKEMANSISRREAGRDEEAAAGEGDGGAEDWGEVDGVGFCFTHTFYSHC